MARSAFGRPLGRFDLRFQEVINQHAFRRVRRGILGATSAAKAAPMMELRSRAGVEQVEIARRDLGVHFFERPDVVKHKQVSAMRGDNQVVFFLREI